ncbi:DUF2334 domain-containing protein [Paraliobacillus sp. PM-2]|uniref:DUF2334 domain-containing protein n=1 Tax=Paraliobacillus sp. PM-2 TaxID=1462524 RepID=UPI000B8856C7|nr:DUF2334 domain-containing protein [Paraliobacillus sp. PM-2]
MVADPSNEPQIVIVYSTDSESITKEKNLLALLLGHFTSDITWINSNYLKETDTAEATHLFYYGLSKKQLSKKTMNILESFSGPFIHLGHNVEQMNDTFSFDTINELMYASSIAVPNQINKKIVVEDMPVLLIETEEDLQKEVLITAKKGERTVPLLVKEKNAYYYATTYLFPPTSYLFADFLHELFDTTTHLRRQVLIRIEDIHPRTDAARLEEIADVLDERNIPYLLSVTPMFKNPKTGDEFFLWENQALVNVLQEMQENGASIVLHGYTDQFKQSPTGTGFEFWDKDRNKPISFLNEKKYITERIEKGVQALVDNELYPLAFEVPHYAISQQGYQVLTEYFSTIVGQIQLTDDDWRMMSASPYITALPTLNGMVLIPETAGYIIYDKPLQSIQDVREKIKHIQIVRDGFVGVFFHPFMGGDWLNTLLDELDSMEQVYWFDLKKQKHVVSTDFVHIETNKGNIKVNHIKNSLKPIHQEATDVGKSNHYVIGLLIGVGLMISIILFSIVRFRHSH